MERVQLLQNDSSAGDRPGISMGSRLPQPPALGGLQVASAVRSPSKSPQTSISRPSYAVKSTAGTAASKSPGAGAGASNANSGGTAGLQPRPPAHSKISFDAAGCSLKSHSIDNQLSNGVGVQQPAASSKAQSPHLNHRRTIGIPACSADKQVRSSLQSLPGHRNGAVSVPRASTLDHGGTRSSAVSSLAGEAHAPTQTKASIQGPTACAAAANSSPLDSGVHDASPHPDSGGSRGSLNSRPGGASRPRTIVARPGSLQASSAYQHGDTRASMLRRSASADKQRQAAAAAVSSSFSYSVKRPTSASSATRASATAVLGGSTSIRPAPPSDKPRSASVARPHQAATSSLVSPPAPSRHTAASNIQSATRASAGTSPVRRSVSSIVQGNSGSAGRPHVKTPTSILSCIPERVKIHAAAGMQQHQHGHTPTQVAHVTAVAAAEPINKPGPPRFSLNLAAVKPVPEPVPEPSPDKAPEPKHQEGSPGCPAIAVPKLNLSTLIQSQAAEQDVGDAYVLPQEELDAIPTAQIPVTLPAKKSSGKNSSGKAGRKSTASAPPPEPEQDHYYFYPKLDRDLERQTMDLIARMPRTQQQHFKKIFTESIQAKQNCEAIAFRGHRLLDQLNSHHKAREKEHEEKEKIMQEELEQYRSACAAQQLELEQMRLALEQERLARLASTPSSPWNGPGFESLTDGQQELLGNTLYQILETAHSAEPVSPHCAVGAQEDSRQQPAHESSPMLNSSGMQSARHVTSLEDAPPLQAPRGKRAVTVTPVPHARHVQHGVTGAPSTLQHAPAATQQLHGHAVVVAAAVQHPTVVSNGGTDAPAEAFGGCDQDGHADGGGRDGGLGSLLLELRKDIRHSRVSDDLAADTRHVL